MKIRAFTVVALCLLLGWQDISAAHSTKECGTKEWDIAGFFYGSELDHQR